MNEQYEAGKWRIEIYSDDYNYIFVQNTKRGDRNIAETVKHILDIYKKALVESRTDVKGERLFELISCQKCGATTLILRIVWRFIPTFALNK
jgi:hypothetical protein